MAYCSFPLRRGRSDVRLSRIFGANIPGKKNAVMFYFGGLKAYRDQLKDVMDNGYKGFKAPFGVEA